MCNFTVAVGEENGEVVFLRTIIPGGADRSYGIHVAQLAGLPRAVIQRATEILGDLESGPDKLVHRNGRRNGQTGDLRAVQLRLLGARDPVTEELADLEVDSLSPLDAIRTLYELRERARSSRV